MSDDAQYADTGKQDDKAVRPLCVAANVQIGPIVMWTLPAAQRLVAPRARQPKRPPPFDRNADRTTRRVPLWPFS